MQVSSQHRYSSYQDYLQKHSLYPADSSIESQESKLVGSQDVLLLKTIQSSGKIYHPSVPDLYISMKRRGFYRGTIDTGTGSMDLEDHGAGFIIISPNTATESFSEGHYELNVVAIPGKWAQVLLDAHQELRALDFGKLHEGLQKDKTVYRLVLQLHHENTLDSNNALLVDGLVMALLGRLVTLANMKNKPRTIKALDAVMLNIVQEYLQDNLCHNPTMQDLANLAGMSVDHFGKSFKKTTGQTPYQYVLGQRLEQAKTCLKDSELSLAEIALSVGFASQAHMNKMFKQHLGITPGSYRRQLS